MAVKAQYDYYTMPPAAKVLADRIDAIAKTLVPGSVVLDIGCNDGSISNALIERGAVSKSYGFDLENILAHRRPELVFQTANLKDLDLTTLPKADGVLALNILHHIVGSSKVRAKEVIDYLLDNYSFVIIDMGSFTEKGEWYWRRAYDKSWHSDASLWNFLFSKAQWRFKLLRYPTQGKGHRTLWKLYKDPYPIAGLEIVETFKRPPAAWPDAKKLIPVSDVGDTKVVESVEFSLARSSRGDQFWVKQYRRNHADIVTEMEMKLAAQAAAATGLINSRMPHDLRAICPLAIEPGGRAIYLYEPDIFAGSIVHFQDWPAFFTPEQCRAGGILGTRPVDIMEKFPRAMLINACDYQLCTAWDGLAALDFEPNNWVVRVLAKFGESGERRGAAAPAAMTEKD